MIKDPQREINQLWAVAEMYHTLATNAKSHLDPTELKMTIGEFAENCKSQSYLDKHTPLLYAVAHLASCAVRLNSIEEGIRSQRWNKYREIAKPPADEGKIKQELNKNIDSLIHFLLRHKVAHSDSEMDRKNKEQKKVYNAMYCFYLDLSYESIFQAMAMVIQSIKNDLDARCLLQ